MGRKTQELEIGGRNETEEDSLNRKAIELTRRQRMLAAIRREAVDCCPRATYNIHPYTDNAHTRDPSYAEILELIAAHAGVAAKVGASGEGVALSETAPGVVETSSADDGEMTVLNTVLHTPRGDLTSVYRGEPGKPGRQTKSLVESDDDIEKFLSLPYEPPEYDVTAVTTLCEAVGDRGLVFVYMSAPVEHVVPLFNYEDFCVRALTDLQTVKRMMDWTFERCFNNARLLARACSGLDCVFHVVGPEYVTPPMIAPRLFGELVTPHLRRLVEVAHEAGFPVVVHCHGRVRDAVPELIAAGVDALEPIEPIPQGDIDLAELLDTYGSDISFMGHVQDQEFYTAAPGHFTRWVESVARAVNGRSGYIMSPTCTPFDFPCTDTYRKNYVEWLEAAERIL